MEICGMSVGVEQDFFNPDAIEGAPKRGQERVSVSAKLGPGDTLIGSYFKLQLLAEALLNGTQQTIDYAIQGITFGSAPELNSVRVGVRCPGQFVEIEALLDPGDYLPGVKAQLTEKVIALISDQIRSVNTGERNANVS